MELPCHNCITLAVCKATANQYDKGHEGIRQVYARCSILQDYLEKYHTTVQKLSPKVTATNLEVVYRFLLPHIFIDKLLYQQRNISQLRGD